MYRVLFKARTRSWGQQTQEQVGLSRLLLLFAPLNFDETAVEFKLCLEGPGGATRIEGGLPGLRWEVALLRHCGQGSQAQSASPCF
jgi:hypothetical protein